MGKDKIDYLDEERKKMWDRITNLEDALKKKTSDYESDAKNASKNTSMYKNRAEESSKASKEFEDAARIHLEIVVGILEKAKGNEEYIDKAVTEIRSFYDLINQWSEDINPKVESLNNLFEEYDTFEENINALNDLETKGQEIYNKIAQLLKLSSEKRSEINSLYTEIVGHTEDNEDGEKVEIPGLKSKLESVYSDLQSKVNSLQAQLTSIITSSQQRFDTKILEFQKSYSEVDSQIKNLLPDAMTAGLSHAYEKKRKDEVIEEQRQTKIFNWAIGGMMTVSLIPFIFSTNQIINKVELLDVIMQLPRVVLAILPLYIPVLWLAYSSNKKRSLSKRLIEEYTHKEVLSKTFEGLSTQISNIEDSNISLDLKNRLLYNVLEVTSDNPGKLISDYNKADHPFMEALDKSTQLANTIEKLSRIPGLGSLIETLQKRATRIIEDKTEQAKKGLDVVNEINESK